jgi:cobalt/nickel transport protein
MSPVKKLWIGLGVLALLSPLGLVIPQHFHAGTAWGEWGGEEIQRLMGYAPQGMKKLEALWRAPFPQYGRGGSLMYLLSAIIGAAATVLLVWLLGKALVRKNDQA